MKRFLKIAAWGMAVLLLLAALDPSGLLMAPLVLLFGWIYFPIRTLPKMTWEPAAIRVGAAALVFLVLITHSLARWLYRHSQVETASPRTWRPQWSAAMVGIVVLLFACGISIIVTIHETYWVLTTKEPIIVYPSVAARRMASTNNLKQIGLAFQRYAQGAREYPPGGTFSPYGEMRHSWETMILPFIEGATLKPNLDLPWNHAANAECFKTEMREFINPGFRSEHRLDKQGYALSHYAVNVHVLGPNRGIKPKDVKDGISNTIMAGEVPEHFQPWGHPVNWRDPAVGINKSPDGFGAPWSGGANMLMMDGSAQFISDKIDPNVLRAMSTPAGGERMPAQIP